MCDNCHHLAPAYLHPLLFYLLPSQLQFPLESVLLLNAFVCFLCLKCHALIILLGNTYLLPL